MASVDFAGKPMVKLDLDFQRLDLAVAGGAASANPGAPAGIDQPWSDKAINLDGLNYFDAEAQVSAAELRIDRFRFAPISVGAILAKGVLTAGVTRTGVYGGQTQGTLVVDASGAEPRHALRVDLTGVRALPLLSDVAGFDAHRRPHAGENRCARARHEPPRDHVDACPARWTCWCRMASFAASMSPS